MSNTTSYSKSNPVLPSENIFTVRVYIPYLDTIFYEIPDELIGVFLEATFSILIARYSTWYGCDDIEQFVELTDKHEERVIELAINTALQFETDFRLVHPNSQLLRDREEFYHCAIENILEHYRVYFIESPMENNDDQIEFLISIFEEKRSISIRYFNYDVITSNLYLFIPC